MVDVIPTKGTRTDTGGTGHRPKKAGVGKSTVQAAQRREKKRKTNRDSARRMRALRKKELENLKEKEKTLDDENEALRKKLIAASQLVERLATEVQDLAAVPLHEKSSREKVVSRTVEEFQVLLHPWKQGTPGPTRANSVVEDKGPARTTEAYFNVPDLASKSSGGESSRLSAGHPFCLQLGASSKLEHDSVMTPSPSPPAPGSPSLQAPGGPPLPTYNPYETNWKHPAAVTRQFRPPMRPGEPFGPAGPWLPGGPCGTSIFQSRWEERIQEHPTLSPAPEPSKMAASNTIGAEEISQSGCFVPPGLPRPEGTGDNHSSTFPGNPQMAMSMEFYNAIINPSGVCIEMRPCNSSSTAYGNPALVSLPQPGLQSSVHATDHAQQHQAVQRSVEDHPETFFSTLMNVDTAELPSYLDWL
eukprot:jgi/Botrbrau1/18939/Bobra.177_2s0085.2